MRDLQSKQDGENEPTPENRTNINQGIKHLVKLLTHSFYLSRRGTDLGCPYLNQKMKKAQYDSIYLLVGNTQETGKGEWEMLGVGARGQRHLPCTSLPRFARTSTDCTARPQGHPGGPGLHPHTPLPPYIFFQPTAARQPLWLFCGLWFFGGVWCVNKKNSPAEGLHDPLGSDRKAWIVVGS